MEKVRIRIGCPYPYGTEEMKVWVPKKARDTQECYSRTQKCIAANKRECNTRRCPGRFFFKVCSGEVELFTMPEAQSKGYI